MHKEEDLGECAFILIPDIWEGKINIRGLSKGLDKNNIRGLS